MVVAVTVMTALLLRAAYETGEWRGFAITELQIAVPMAIAWRLFAERRSA